MNLRLSACAAIVAVTGGPLVTGCATTYVPRPNPRVQVVMEGSSMTLVKDGHSYPFSRFGGGLEEAVQGNPHAEAEARSYRDKTITGFVLSTVGLVATGVGAGALVDAAVQQNPPTTIMVASLTSLIGGLVLSIVGGAVAGSAQPHMWNAINIYNDGLSPYAGWAPQAGYPGYPAAPGYAVPGYAVPGAAVPGYAAPGYAMPAAPGYPVPAYAPPGYAPPGQTPPGARPPAPAVPPAPAPAPAPAPR